MKIWVLLLAALASASPVIAQEPTPPLVPQHSQSIMETLIKAGPVMIPLFLLSIFFVMLVVVYLMTIRRGAVVSSSYIATDDALPGFAFVAVRQTGGANSCADRTRAVGCSTY